MNTGDLQLDSAIFRLISLNILLEGPNVVAGRQLDSAILIFFLTTLFAHVTPYSSTQLVFYLTHEHVAHGNEPTCQFTWQRADLSIHIATQKKKINE